MKLRPSRLAGSSQGRYSVVTENMNVKYAEPETASTAADPEVSPAELRRTSISSWLGSALEYMDFTLYTLAAALVFGPLFFPNTDPAMALLASFAAYGSGFLVRPLGGIYFGYLEISTAANPSSSSRWG